MKKNYFRKSGISLSKYLLLLLIIFGGTIAMKAQVRVPFTQRTSQASPNKKIYNINGDFTMIGNTNMTSQNYNDNINNSLINMVVVDVDSDNSTTTLPVQALPFPMKMMPTQPVLM